jgi:hypothetical protein
VHVPQGKSNRDIAELPGPVDLGHETAAGDTVMKTRGHLIDPVPLAEDIDDQRGFHAPAAGQWLHRIKSLPGDAAHPRQRLSGPEPGEMHHARSGQPDHQPMTAARRLLRGQHRDGHVRAALTHRGHEFPGFGGCVFKIGVKEQQMPGAGRVPSLKLSDGLRARHHRSRLTVTPAPADHQRARFTGEMSCLITRCVIDDDHETAERGGRRHRRSYPELLISGRNDHCDVRAGRVRHGPEISSARHGTEIISPRHRKTVTWRHYDGGSPRYLNDPPRGDFVPALAHRLRLLVMIGLAEPSEPAPA